MTTICITVYFAAIVTANWLVANLGQAALPYTAFVLIPFDLVIRDLLQDRWVGTESRASLTSRMGLLILSGGLLSCLLFPESLRVSVASFTAFTLTGIIDALTYQWMLRKYGRLVRINLATIVGATIDSIVFVLIAFDEVDPVLVVAQVASKSFGGFIWSLLLYRYFRKGRRTDVHTYETVQIRGGTSAS